MTEPNFQIFPVNTHLSALKEILEQVTKSLVEHHLTDNRRERESERGNIYQELSKVLDEVTTQVAFDNSHDNKHKTRGCKSHAANILGISRATFRMRMKRFDIELTPMDEDIPH